MRPVLLLLCSVLPLCADPPAGYYDSALGKTGQELKAALHVIIRANHTPIRYERDSSNNVAAIKVLDEDSANTNNVWLLYAQRTEPKTNYGAETWSWNREHLWPNSMGIDDGEPMWGDLHNLRAEDLTLNSARGDKWYDVSDPNETPYRNPAHAEAPLCTADVNSWQPASGTVGDIARALFYMDVRYEGDGGEANLILTDVLSQITSATNLMGRLSTLLHWHYDDAVDDRERRRNDLVFGYQRNRNRLWIIPNG
jgi:endonuclease I